MVPLNDWLLFAGATLLMALTPGPNMVYLISRSICQGRRAGVISLFGVVAGFLVHMFTAAVGLTALFMAVPLAYEILKWAGAAYLLNPKIAVFYLAIFPQFVTPEHGSVFAQSVVLGLTQIVFSFSVNLSIALSAAKLARWFQHHRRWLAVQRYVMGGVLAALAVRLAAEQRRMA